MRKTHIAICFVILFGSVAFSQEQDTLWSQIWGVGFCDHANDVDQTMDGGFIAFGSHYNDREGVIVKFDSLGEAEWYQDFVAGTGNCGFQSGQQTSDGGFICAGSIYDQILYYDFWLVKTDDEGVLEWEQTYGTNTSEECNCVQQTTDGGYVLAGYVGSAHSDWWLIKTDEDGEIEWDQTYGNESTDKSYSVKQTNDGGYILTGFSYITDESNCNLWLLKTDSEGNQEWLSEFGISADDANDYGYDVIQTSDGGYAVIGETRSYGAGGSDAWLIKTDEDGLEEWNQTYGGERTESGNSLQQTLDGGFIIAGDGMPADIGGSDFCVIKTNMEGEEEWSHSYGAGQIERALSVELTTDGGFIVSGFTNSFGVNGSDMWLFRYEGLLSPTPFHLLTPTDAEWLTINDTTEIPFSWGISSSLNPDETVAFDLHIHAGYGDIDSLTSIRDIVETDTALTVQQLLGLEYWDSAINCSWYVEAIAGMDTTSSMDTFSFRIMPHIFDYPPSEFTLLSPEDDALIEVDESLVIDFAWQSSTDPNPDDTVVYDVIIHGLGSGIDSTTYLEAQTDTTLSLTVTELMGLINWETTLAFDWSVTAVSSELSTACTEDFTFNIEAHSTVGNNATDELPTEFAITSIFPNPFNPETEIRFSLPERATVHLAVFDITGREVANLANQPFQAGQHALHWNAADQASGVYFLRMTATGNTPFEATRKMMLVK